MNSKILVLLISPFLSLLIVINKAHGQQSRSYFDFWTEGEWVSELTLFEEDTIIEKDRFVVEKSQSKNGFLESWEIYIGDDEYIGATVIKAFDSESNEWKLFYVDDLNAQTWDSQFLDGKVYFFKTFEYQGKQFYSRQAWSKHAEGKVLRTIERSVDGKNWSTRYWQIFMKLD